MVPVTTQHAILDRSLRKRIAHMRTTAIERSDLPVGTQQQNMTIFQSDDFEWTLLQFGDIGSADKVPSI
jgi:hypothetical protein